MSTAYLLPVADGNYTSFTASGAATDWECVDDPVASPDNDTTYVSFGTSTPTRESVILAAYTAGGIINSVTVTVLADLSGAASDGQIALFLRIAGSDYDGDSQTLLRTGGYITYTAAWTTNPDTSAAWAYADLAALEAGALVTNPVFATTRITQIYAAIDYTPQITYAADAVSLTAGIQADWPPRAIKRRSNNGAVEYQPYTVHTWEANTMLMTEFEALKALQGAVLTSLQTTDIDNPNQQATYTGAEITGVVSGGQVGRRAVNCRVEFKVDVS